MPVQRALAVVRHEDLHLAFRQVLDLLVFGAEFPLLSFRCVRSFFEAFESKELVPNEGLRTACDSMLSRRADEVARRFLVLRAQCDLSVRSRCHILLESLADLQQLRKALHRKQKRRVRSARRIQDLAEILISEWRELIHDNREQWPVHSLALFLALVPLPNDQLDVL